jgi:hypothetical protein
MKLCKLLLAVVSATALFGALVGTASAGRFNATEQRITATFSRVEFTGGFATARCELTLAASIHSRTLPKVLETLIGYVTGASVGGCERGSATVLTGTLPWHMRYTGFTGTLPTISAISSKVIVAAFRIREPAGFECLFTTLPERPMTFTWNLTSGIVSTIRLGGTIPCGITNLTLVGTDNGISPSTSIRLI